MTVEGSDPAQIVAELVDGKFKVKFPFPTGGGPALLRADESEVYGEPAGSSIYHVTIPKDMEQTDLSTPIIEREGGPTPADHDYRDALYSAVGRVTVASGLVEAALKRVLVVLSPEREAFEQADFDWSNLEIEVRKVAARADALDRNLGQAAVKLLDKAEAQGLRDLRNDVTHGAWWTFAGPERFSRWPRRSTGHMRMLPLAEVQRLGQRIQILAAMLDDLVRGQWPIITLPAPKQPDSIFHQSGDR